MISSEDRLNQIESRIERIEAMIQSLVANTPSQNPEQTNEQVPKIAQNLHRREPNWSAPARKKPAPSNTSSVSVTSILGWAGATALVLSAVYLIRLAIDSGWLTPGRQIGLAALAGLAMMAGGLWLRQTDRHYASLLPAGGLVIWFMATYGAHLYYHMIPAQIAVGAVVATCLVALWLGRLFESELFALFAVVGSYSSPFFLPILSGSITDLVVYFSAWSVLFSVYAIWIGKRRVYLLAAYLALLGFAVIREQAGSAEWMAALVFQGIQFLVFLAAAAIFSVRRSEPMDSNTALAHLPLLLIFYALQYELMRHHIPTLAPWIAMASATLVLLAYLAVRRWMQTPTTAGGILASAYIALVLFHAGYLESIPEPWQPWVAALMLPLLVIYLASQDWAGYVPWPLKWMIGIVFAINYLRVLADADLARVPAHDLLALLYAAQLYVGYFYARRVTGLNSLGKPLLYAAHIALMAAAVQIFDERLAVSAAWGIIGLACLSIALRVQDKKLGKSSLLIFAISAAKVLLFDLAGSTPLVRIACLFVLGVTLYAGGWLFRKIDAMPEEKKQTLKG
ncbi:MAG: DUF2339 domain-containing protein [Sulfuricellaceae bacterium]|nr:DUF2339 domain-containing protein [Sulfuricellaceae bacterium]